MWAWPHTNSVSRAQGHHHNAALALFLTLNIMGHVLCTHTEVLEKKHKKERVRPAVSLGTQREALAAAGVCVSVKPAELSSLLAAEELMRMGGDCLPSGADSEGWNVLGPNSLPLAAVMWTTAPTH